MKNIVVLAALLAATSAAAQSNGERSAPSGTIHVMVLGVAHLVSRRDVHNATFTDSPLSPKRQAEISQLVGDLARYRPTKVLVEAPLGDTAVINRYRRFVEGREALAANEVDQFGFRLARQSGDSAIYPIDTFGPGLINEASDSGKRILAFLKANFARVTTPSMAAFLARQDTLERTGTYLDLLRYLNTDAAIRANASFYSVLDGMGRDSDYAGSAYVAEWYTRNCYIFSNVLSVLRPGDRAIVIMGQGHEYLLREFVRLHPDLVDVDPLSFLE